VEATQIGNINYSIASPVRRSFVVAKANLNIIANAETITYKDLLPTLSFAYNAADFVNSETSTVIDTPPSIATTAIASSGAGSYPIALSGGADDNYNLILTNAILTIAQSSQNITFNPLADKIFGDANVAISATASSSLAVSFSIASGPATLSGNTLSITGAGTVVIEATQTGDANYLPASAIQQSFIVTKALAEINFLNNLTNYNGSAQAIPFETVPAGLPVNILYNGSSSIPSDQGSYNIAAEIQDNNYQGTATTIYIINGAPVVTTIPDFNYDEDEGPISTITLSNFFSDVEDDANSLLFSIISASNATLFSRFHLSGAELAIALTADSSGTSTVTVRCTDSNGLFTESSLIINIASIEDLPIFSSVPIITINEDQEYQYVINASDADFGDEIIISSILTLPPWLSFTYLGNGTGVLFGIPTNNQIGNYGIALEVSDLGGNKDQQFFNIEVLNTNDVPVITSIPIRTASLNTAYSYTFTATDVDVDDELTIQALKIPSWLSTNQPGQGKLELTGTPTDSDRNESTEIRIAVSDLAGATVAQSFFINVNFPNTAPSFSSSPLISINEDEAYSYSVLINDIENDPYSISALTIPSWLSLSKEGDDYTIEGLPKNQDVGTYQVILEAIDQLGARNTQNFSIEVFNVNDTPNFNTTPILIATQNKTYQLELIVEDIDKNDSYTLTFLVQPAWLSIIDNKFLTGIPLKDDVDLSPFAVSILLQDLAGATDTLNFLIDVRYENSPPTMASLPSAITLEEDNLSIQTITLENLTPGDETNQTLTLSLEVSNIDLFEYAIVNYTAPNTQGAIEFKLAANAFGTSEFTIALKDNGPQDINTITQKVQLIVNSVNDIPVFTSSPIIKAQANTTYQYDILCIDNDPSDLLEFTLIQGPDWLTLTKQSERSAKLSGNVPITATSESITIGVTDLLGAKSEQRFEIQINNQPTITDATFEVYEDVAFLINFQLIDSLFNDADNESPSKIIINWTDGTLFNNGLEISKNTEIVVKSDLSLSYLVSENFVGSKLLTYSMADQFIFSEPASLNLIYLAVNDRPILTNLESSQLEYIQGSPAIPITESISISDVDNQAMDSALVYFSNNYNVAEDRLFFENQLIDLSVNFDAATGILLFIGEQSKSVYESALSSITYKNINPLSTDTELKTISLLVSDGEKRSNILSRELILSEVLPELAIVNAFTPNQDGVNDTWGFSNLEQFNQVSITIISAAGQPLFECFSNDCRWDGMYNGELLPSNTYFYRIELNGGRRIYEGSVTILR
jgi:gliding motility-associated-like protein